MTLQAKHVRTSGAAQLSARTRTVNFNSCSRRKVELHIWWMYIRSQATVEYSKFFHRHLLNEITLWPTSTDSKDWVDWETANTEVGVGRGTGEQTYKRGGPVQVASMKPDTGAELNSFTGPIKWGWEGEEEVRNSLQFFMWVRSSLHLVLPLSGWTDSQPASQSGQEVVLNVSIWIGKEINDGVIVREGDTWELSKCQKDSGYGPFWALTITHTLEYRQNSLFGGTVCLKWRWNSRIKFLDWKTHGYFSIDHY